MASAEKIRSWYVTLERGGSLEMPHHDGDEEEYERSLLMATVRALNGLGVDRTDANGERAMTEVRAALADPPAPDRR